MADLTFDPHQSVDTLRAVLGTMTEHAALFSEAEWTAVAERHQQLCSRLPDLRDYQRTMPIIEFLGWLAAQPAVVAVAGAALNAGKSPPRRSGFVQISEAQVATLSSAFSATRQLPTADSRVEIAFYVAVDFPQEVAVDAEQPLIVRLVRTAPAPAQQAGMVLLTFRALDEVLPVAVTLRAPDFVEQTGDWTRTMPVSATGDGLPAVFLLQAAATPAEQTLTFTFQQPLGSVIQPVSIIVPAKSPVMRGAEMLSMTPYTDVTVDYAAQVDFPAQILPRSVHRLIVHFDLAERADEESATFGLTFADARRPELIEVVLTAPDFGEQTGVWQRAVILYAGQRSQPAVFLVQAGATLGEKALTLDFYHKQRLLGSQRVTVQVAAAGSPVLMKGKRQVETERLGGILAEPPPPADVTLRVVLDPLLNTLHFCLDAANPALGLHRAELGTTPLHHSPRQFLTQTFAQLSALAGSGTATAAEQANRIEAIAHMGQLLFETLLPEPLRAAYWQLKTAREQGKIRSLLIISDEPWIPWELIKPFAYDAATDQTLEDGFWAESFQLCRWLAGRGPEAALTINSARLVVPETDLAYVQREQHFFQDLGTRGLDVGAPLRTKAELLQATQSGTMRMLHLATHGTFTPENADESAIVLHNDEQLYPTDLAGARSVALRRQRPLIFFNTCHSSQLDFVLTGLGGWAQKLVREIGVSAFIGALWEVNDELAAEFALRFYQELIDGQPFGAAFQRARLAIRDQDPANPTWLAYTLYADPNGRATWEW